MRKIFAYLVTIVTLIATVVFFAPGMKDSTNFAMEYTGGFEVIYKAKSATKDVKDNQIANTISDGMNKILDINDIDETIVTVEDGNYIRVNVTSKNQIISDEIRNLIQNKESYEITFRDANDKLLATGDKILKSVGAEYNGETNYYGYPIIYLNISDTDLLNSITSQVSNDSTNNKLVIWVGFDAEVDSYANIETNATTAKKVIYNATVNEPLNDEVITVTGEYTEDEAKNTVNLINSGTYDYELETIQVKSIKESEAKLNKTLMLIAALITIVLPMLFIGIYFKFEGVCSLVSVVVYEFAILALFNKIVGVINPQVVGAFVLANVVFFMLMFMLLSKYKSSIATNKSPIKAYKEVYKKNGFIIFDTAVTMIIFALVTYFLGNNAHNFAIYLAVSAVSVLISLYLVQRFVMYLTCDCFNKTDRSVIVSSSSNISKEEVKDSITKNIDSYSKPVLYGFFGLVGLAAIVILITTLVFKSPFTFYDDGKQISTLELSLKDEQFKNEDDVRAFFNKENIDLDLESVKLGFDGERYTVIVTSLESFSSREDEINSELEIMCGKNEDFMEYYTIYLNEFDTVAMAITLKSTLYTSGIALLIVAIYYALRYKYSYSLATISSAIMTSVSLVAFFGLTRIPVNSYTVIGISVVSAYSLFMLVPFFTKIKEYMNDTKKVYLSYAERVDCFKKGRNSIIKTVIIATLILDVSSLIIMFFDLSNFSMYLSFILGSVFALIYNMVLVPKIWVLFENKRDRRKRTFKNRNISKSKYRTLDEQVFIGLND